MIGLGKEVSLRLLGADRKFERRDHGYWWQPEEVDWIEFELVIPDEIVYGDFARGSIRLCLVVGGIRVAETVWSSPEQCVDMLEERLAELALLLQPAVIGAFRSKQRWARHLWDERDREAEINRGLKRKLREKKSPVVEGKKSPRRA